MANLYQEWSLEQDRMLWEYRNEPVSTIAARLGRGLRGVETRLAKLKDPSSNAYMRLFSDDLALSNEKNNGKKPKFVPASEVLRRIRWDASLPSQDFSILYYDRVEDEVLEAPFDAPNTSIKGKATNIIDALPEHRIKGIKFKEQIVWDRDRRLDLVFSAPGIARVMESYDAWKQARDAEEETNRKRQAEVSYRLQSALGTERFTELKELSREIQTTAQREDNMLLMLEVEKYVQVALTLFRQARENPSSSLAPSLIAINDYEALDQLSEIVALLPDPHLKPVILTEVLRAMKKVEGKPVESQPKDLPEIDEADVVETFVRGSGPGGQKVNKTSNRVSLLHVPTGLRVECQDTRSLQQNRKIARKRLRLKLDEYLNGSQSRTSLAAQKAAAKKLKSKARSRSRQKQKREANNDPSSETVED
ncbi:hypothetical protein FisN_6Lh386 [Fistulifera solaris]|uniref:Prokaryotic-type class I peptide chain release factors domain-containing protein n=1 Tax=Fistulifera solaris TaxID=1519565 RepID=A0A1Z5JKU5_FISSO|nr:hypothetical protein FisN_6Lh386 [Fistulifera solaris]|eukprot:GAX14604.1 hypothetical protein FisN_6Lh386 [Fistulifera solaris]